VCAHHIYMYVGASVCACACMQLYVLPMCVPVCMMYVDVCLCVLLQLFTCLRVCVILSMFLSA
jgi:hypothetical protein